MNSISRFPPYIIAAAVIFMITFYHIFNLRSKNYNLERSSTIVKEALKVSKEKNKVLVKDALEKIEKKDARIKQLEQENYLKHTKLGEKQTKLSEMRSELETKNDKIKKLYKLADDHKAEIMTLSESVAKSKNLMTELSGKADHLMVDHKKLKKENTKLTKENEKLQNDLEKEQSEKANLDDELQKLKKENKAFRVKVDGLTRKIEVIQESIKQKIKGSVLTLQAREEIEVKDPGLQESYAARRVMTHQPREKETTEEQPTHELSKGLKYLRDKFGWQTDPEQPKVAVKSPSGKVFSKFGHKDSEQPTTLSSSDQMIPTSVADKDKNASELIADRNVSEVLVDNLDDRNVSKGVNSDNVNVSKVIVDNSDDTQSNISRVMVNNTENMKITDIYSTTKSSFVRKSLNGSDIDLITLQNKHFIDNLPRAQHETITPEQTSDNVQQRAYEEKNIGVGDVKRQIRSKGKDGETAGDGDEGLSDKENLKRERLNEDKEKKFEGETENEQVNGEEKGELVVSQDKDKMFKEKKGSENMRRVNEGGLEEGNSEMRSGRYTLPVFPKIQDKLTVNVGTLKSPKVYGEHLDGNAKQNTVTTGETDT